MILAGPRRLEDDRARAWSSVVELARARALAGPSSPAYTFLTDGESTTATLDYGELDLRARRIAAAVQQRAGRAGRRVLLLYAPGLEYPAAFLGCLYAGAIAVPVYPPSPTRLKWSLPRLESIIADADADLVLTTSDLAAMVPALAGAAPRLAALSWLATDQISPGTEDGWSDPSPGADDVAFLQYTSGSTGAPKGVVLSHGNLLHNMDAVHRAFGNSPATRGVIWLPPFHDMGLIGGILQPLYGGFPVVLMSPLAFLERPLRWLEAMSRFRGTVSGGPNFAYDLCARKADGADLSALDLSRWEVAFSGAEPVRAETLDRFAAAFAGCGFRREAFLPCYGLAEATLIVSGDQRRRGPLTRRVSRAALLEGRIGPAETDEDARALVGCGTAVAGTTLRIVDPDTGAGRSAGEIGEICVRGPSVARGYWGRERGTAATFGAHLRTGDLGFVDADGQLFVTGRAKDLIVLRGLNHHPQDIERTAEASHPLVRPGCCAAFSVEIGDEERLVVVCEVNHRRCTDGAEVVAAITDAIVRGHDARPHVVLLAAGTLPKTSSGKVQRRACRDAHLAAALEVVHEAGRETSGSPEGPLDPATPTTAAEIGVWLADRLGRRAGLPPQSSASPASPASIDLTRSLASFGLDSIASVELLAEIQSALRVSFPLSALLRWPTLAELARQLSAAPAVAPRRPGRASADGDHSLGEGQRSLWLMHQLAPASPVHHIAHAFRIDAPLDLAALRGALDALVERHPALRTTFPVLAHGPVQRVASAGGADLEEIDATAWDEAELVARLNQEAARPFDLERGPLLRARLFTRGPDDRAIVLAVHHLVADLWSLTVLLQELGALLDARSRGQAPSLPPRGAAYTDHVREQERQLEGAEGERLWAYWRAQLQDAIPPLELPTDRPRPAVRRFGGGVVRRRLSAELWSRTRAFAARHNSTAFHVLLAAHGALLSRWSGQTDFAVGVPVADRARAGVARTVGYFVNPVPLRLRLDGGPTFAELLARTRETVLAGLDHQALPFPLLVERLQPSPDRSRSPVFQSMFTFQQSHLAGLGALASVAVDEPGVSMRLGDLELRSIALDRRASPFDLSMSVAADDRGLALALEYSADLFDAPTIERFATCFENLLDAAIAGPSTPLEELDILPASERRDLLGWGNGPATGPSAPSDCVARFEAQASRTPDAVAITCEGRTTTYGALALRAADLASVLRTHGVGPDVRVGIHMRRSPEMVVSLLGVLTAGGAYVPLDPDDPADRRAMVLADASPRVVLTQPALAAALTARDGMTVLVVGSGEPSAADDLEEARGQGRRRPVDGDQLAYILYTSGSTGRPKGVMVSHRSLARYVDWAGRAYGAGPGGSAPVHSPLSFDLTVTSLLVPLTHGGAVTLISGDAATGALAGALRGRAALVKLTPAHLEMLAHQLEPTEPGERAHVFVVGGDALRTDVVRHWRERAPASRIINEYGPTETTVGCTIYEGPAVATASGTVPVGRPIAGARVHVLDRRCALQPVGVAGELFIGGDGLARGYVGRPDLTAERFVPDPSGEHPGARLYRSGDRARWRADGQLELLGRLDRQVKLRSHRIELGEIEAALTACSSVREAAVFLDRDGHEPRLVACIVWRPGQAADLTALRAALRAALPAHMVPGAFVALDALPLTPNGKLDRSALPRPGAAASGRPHVESRTSVETGLAEIFAQVLGVERPGAHDDFFALGGHSLLAIRVTAHLRDAFDVDVPVTAIFEAPTIAALAGRIEEARGRGRELPPLRPIARDGGPLRLSFAQERLWFLHQLEPDSPRYHVCAALRAVGPLDPSAFASAVGQVIDRHEILRTVFVDDEGRPAQLVRPFMAVPLAVLDLCGAPADARDATLADATREAAMRPFDLERGPLLRVLSIRIAEDEHVIVLVLHHIVFDGWSVDVLARELGALYAARLAGAPSPLPDLPVQYADYAAWQRAWLDGDRLAGQLAYWTGKLDGAPAALDLPTDRPRPARASGRGASLPIALAPAQVSALGACAARDGATLFMALCAAWAALLGRRAGQPEVVVGIPVASRRDAALEPLIGLFVNSLPLRVNLGGRPSFRALLARVRSTALEALAHQDLPFERIVEAVGPGRHPGRTPLFQTMLVVHTAPPTLALDRLSLAITEIPTHTAKLELTLTLTETAGGLAGALEYSTDLFDAASIAGLAADLERLLVAVVADPDAPVDSISLVGERERATAVTSPPQAEPDRRPPTAPRPPRDLERTLARIWCDVLGIDEVGRTEDFFDVGGHSLATTRVAARVARELGIKPPLAMFFEARTIAEQAARMAAELPATDRTPALRPIGRETPPPASSPQRRLWLLEQMEPGSTRHHIAGAARLRGQLSVDALERALQRIVERHEILRTTFLSVDGEPFQHVSPCATAVLERVDVSAVADPATRNAMALELAAEEARRPFDLAAGPLFRTRLVRVAELEHLLVVCFHHIVSDGWSRGVFLRDLGALYEAERDGAGALLADLPVQYGDFAAWERDRLRRDAWADDLAHWKAKLATLPVLELPTDHARPRVATGRGGVVRFELPSGAEGDLRALCTATGATPFMVLVAAWGALLARHAGERRILIGTPVANRGRPELEELIGFFVNMLVLEVDLAGGPSFRQLVERVRGDALDAYAHQDLPFERLVEELNPPRDVGRAPIFQVMAVMNDAPAGRPRLADVSVEEVELDTVSSHCDLSLFLGQRDGAMVGAIQYSADLFDRETVERMADRFRALLAAATRRPDLTVDQLPMLSEAERRTIAVDWNDTSRSFDGPETLHALVRDQATRRPDATAVVFGDERMSFAELDRRASQLAHRLRSLGADVDRPVALILERSAELVVAILGVLKAGAAYVPIEPTLPAARIALVLDDVRPVAIVALQRLADRIPTAAIPAILIDADDLSAEPAHDPLVDVPPDASAYVIYTSGSTGRPKGVVVSHRAIRNRLLWMRDAFPLGESDVVLHKTPYGFDVSIWELFQPLLAGARLVVARPDGHRDAAYLIDEIVSRGVTVCHFVPSMLRLFLDEPGVERARCLSRVFTSGEALTPDLQDGLLDRVKCKVVNLYGPTEAAVEVSVWQCRYGSSTVPIGRPIANVRLHVVDAGGQLAPIGVPGELCIGGVALARGYLGQPALTAAAFVPDPFSPDAGARMYRTGDVARWRHDGAIEFLGRRDGQIKLRGQRVELGEIEAALLRVPDVKEAAVAVQDLGSDPRLVAYVVAQEGGRATAAEIRTRLRAALPATMVPAHLVFLAALPLTSSGKVDRKALPAPTLDREAASAPFAPPRDQTEGALAAIFSQVLAIERVGIEDDFFQLGGNSLLASRVIARIEGAFGRKLPLRDLFRAPTVAGLAAAISRDTPARRPSALVPMQARGDGHPIYFAPPISGSVAYYAKLARALGSEQPFIGLQARGLEGDGEPFSDIPSLAAWFADAIRQRQPRGPYRIGGWSLGGYTAWEIARILRASGEEVSSLILLSPPLPVEVPVRGGEVKDDAFFLGRLLSLERFPWNPGETLSAEERLRRVMDRARHYYTLEQTSRPWIAEFEGPGPRIPGGVDFDEAMRLVKVFKLSTWAQERYVPPPFDGEVDCSVCTAHAELGTPEQQVSSVRAFYGPRCAALRIDTIHARHTAMVTHDHHVAHLVGFMREALGRR